VFVGHLPTASPTPLADRVMSSTGSIYAWSIFSFNLSELQAQILQEVGDLSTIFGLYSVSLCPYSNI